MIEFTLYFWFWVTVSFFVGVIFAALIVKWRERRKKLDKWNWPTDGLM